MEVTQGSRDECEPTSPNGMRSTARISKFSIFFARLAIGLIVLICAEVLSGASLPIGLWHPWTLIVTYWLYYAHFFFFTTLAVRTRRTSLPSLYLWGVLFGLYESWITKVIWSGYGGVGKFVLGKIGPYGFSEISMVFLFHPVMSLILPLAIACVLCPALRQLFPGLAWITGTGKWARWIRAYLIVAFAPIMAMNSGSPANLAINLVVAIVGLSVLRRFARPALASPHGEAIAVFTGRGFVGLCAYLILLYGVTYLALRRAALPSLSVQLFTFVFYGVVIVGLWYHGAAPRLSKIPNYADHQELQRVTRFFAILFAAALILSTFAGTPFLNILVGTTFVIWTPLGFVLTTLALFGDARKDARSPD